MVMTTSREKVKKARMEPTVSRAQIVLVGAVVLEI